MSATARRIAGAALGVLAIALLVREIGRLTEPLAEAEACARALHEARALSPSERTSRPTLVTKACAPLFREERCRVAHEKFELPHPSERAAKLAEACRDAYCDKLAQPRPVLCATSGLPKAPSELAAAWSQFVPVVLEAEHGGRAKPAIEAMKRPDERSPRPTRDVAPTP